MYDMDIEAQSACISEEHWLLINPVTVKTRPIRQNFTPACATQANQSKLHSKHVWKEDQFSKKTESNSFIFITI